MEKPAIRIRRECKAMISSPALVIATVHAVLACDLGKIEGGALYAT